MRRLKCQYFRVRLAIGIEIADFGGKGRAGGVVAKGKLQQAGDPEVAVDGLGNAHHPGAGLPEVFCQEGGIGIGVVPAHHHQSIQLQRHVLFIY